MGLFAVAALMYRRKYGIKFMISAVLSAALCVAAAGIQINIAREYIKSWSELPALIGISTSAAANFAKVHVPDIEIQELSFDNPESNKYKLDLKNIANTKFGGQYLETIFTGPSSGISQPVRIWLPRGWNNLQNLKVLIFLHGFPSNPPLTMDNLGVDKQLSELIAQNQVAPTIMVFPEIRPDNQEPDCTDIDGRPKVGSYVINDLVNMVKANFPVSANRNDWAISGNSAGAYCAGLLAGLYPQRFGSAIILSGYDNPELGRLAKSHPDIQQQYTVSKNIAQTRLPLRIYNFAAGNDRDALELKRNIEKVDNSQVDITNVYYHSGAHNWKSWHKAFPDALKWFAPASKISAAKKLQQNIDHSLEAEHNWLSKVTIGHIHTAYIIFCVLWTIFLIRYFRQKTGVKHDSEKNITPPRLQKNTALNANSTQDSDIADTERYQLFPEFFPQSAPRHLPSS
ncbi:alpha/beta hydrolase-fold protein [Arcanobacterium hippocoleae]